MSNGEVNKALRVLTETRLKYTIKVTTKCGADLEFQSEYPVRMQWNDSLRRETLMGKFNDGTGDDYGNDYVIMPDVSNVLVVLIERNPE